MKKFIELWKADKIISNGRYWLTEALVFVSALYFFLTDIVKLIG